MTVGLPSAPPTSVGQCGGVPDRIGLFLGRNRAIFRPMKNSTRFAIVPLLVLWGCGGGGGHSDTGVESDGQRPLDTGAIGLDGGFAAIDTVAATATPDAPGTVSPTDTGTPDAPRPSDAGAPDAVADASTANPGDVLPDTASASPDSRRTDTQTSDTPSDPSVAPASDAATINLDARSETAPDASSPDTVSDAFVKLDTMADTMAADTATADASLVIPILSSISPANGNVGQPITLSLTGTGFEAGAVAYFDGQALATVVNGAASLMAQVTAGMTAQAGSHAVWVANATNRVGNTLYVTLVIPVGAPEILDYNPDNGLVGDTITIIGNNLTSEAITITGPNNVAASPGATGSQTWLGTTAETVTFALPTGWQTGPIVVANSKGSSRGKIFNVGKNLAHMTGATVQASSEYSSAWSKDRGADNDLSTSWFSAIGDCATDTSCTSVPWIRVTFPSAQSVSRIAIRGNREYASGYDFLRANVDVVGEAGLLWTGSYNLPNPDRDLDITLPAPVVGATSVKFTSLGDESSEPGLSEVEVF
jgi:hypothetical protein